MVCKPMSHPNDMTIQFDMRETESKDKIKAIDYDDLYNKYDELTNSFVEAYVVNNFTDIKKILNETQEYALCIHNSHIEEIKNHRFVEEVSKILDKKRTSKKEINAAVREIYNDKIWKVIHIASCYSLFYALDDIGEKIKSFVIMPELIQRLPDDAKWHIVEIFMSGYLNKEKISSNILDLLMEENLCFTDNKKRVFLTAKGANLARELKDIDDFVSMIIEEKEKREKVVHPKPDESFKEIQKLVLQQIQF